ncbi:hypothetical protein GW17_00054250, partial [Ensete ventricosum]
MESKYKRKKKQEVGSEFTVSFGGSGSSAAHPDAPPNLPNRDRGGKGDQTIGTHCRKGKRGGDWGGRRLGLCRGSRDGRGRRRRSREGGASASRSIDRV